MQQSGRGWGTRGGSAWGRDRFRRTLQQLSACGSSWEGSSARRQCRTLNDGAWLEDKRQQTGDEKNRLTGCQKTLFSPWQQSSSGTDFAFPTLRGVKNLTGWNPELPEQLTLFWVGDWNRHCSRSLPAWVILWSCDSIPSNKSDLHIFICKKLAWRVL